LLPHAKKWAIIGLHRWVHPTQSRMYTIDSELLFHVFTKNSFLLFHGQCWFQTIIGLACRFIVFWKRRSWPGYFLVGFVWSVSISHFHWLTLMKLIIRTSTFASSVSVDGIQYQLHCSQKTSESIGNLLLTMTRDPLISQAVRLWIKTTNVLSKPWRILTAMNGSWPRRP